jgi:hypothetical protein
MKNWTNKQTMMVVGSLLLLLAVRAISQVAREDEASGQRFQPSSQGVVSAPARGFEQDSSDAGMPAQDNEQPMGDTLEPSMDANAGGFSPSETQPSETISGGTLPSGEAGMGSDGVALPSGNDQESHDRVTLGFDNLIKDEVTLENPNTGEVIQGEAGSSNYYQSPSVDGATGEATIIGAEGGYTPPADATQLNIVGSDSGSSSAASSDSSSSTP